MRVLVIGGGAREHALALRLSRDASVSHLVCAPGNPGIARLAELDAIDLADVDAMLATAMRHRIDLTVVGPELPLSLGVADRFHAAGQPIVGPTAAAARLESSKAFAKDFMARHAVPTARFRVCDSEQEALKVVGGEEFKMPLVIKADGLAAGKGVMIVQDREQAEADVASIMRERRFGDAGRRIVIEECLAGTEVSFFALSDGSRVIPFGTAQDHKRIFDDDRGPNTGGMGAFAPAPSVNSVRVMDAIVMPVVRGMAAEGHPFRGFLYVGLMLTAHGPQVIEFNVRLGDPEAQVVLPLIEGSLAETLRAAATNSLRLSSVRLGADKHVGVVLASRGYPDASEAGTPVAGIEEAERLPGVTVLQAGTAMRNGKLVTNGGRVLTVVGRGGDFNEARERAYAGVRHIAFDGMQCRRDIGRKALPSATSGNRN